MVEFVEKNYRVVDAETTEADEHGRVRHFLNNAIGIIENEHIVGMWGTQRDVTERKELEEKMRQTQKLESLGLLAGGIVHDLNNILTSILGGLSFTRLRMDASSPFQEELEVIEKAAERAANFCCQLQGYAGGGNFEIKPIQLGELVQETADIVRMSFPKSLTLECDLAKDLPWMEADSTQIQQVVMNLLTNASEAVGYGTGLVRVETRASEDRQAVLLRVTDNGCGISEEQRARLFDPFYSTKGSGEGRGLGLCAVQGIVSAHQGTLSLHSAVGSGTSFEIRFPATERNASAPRAPKRRAVVGNIGHVLVVDDEEGIRSLTKRCLEHHGFEVSTAADGLQALDLMTQDPSRYSLVLIDISMPNMSGPELLDRVRELRPTMPIVMSSGYEKKETMVRINLVGRCAFLRKPYVVQDLVDKVIEAQLS